MRDRQAGRQSQRESFDGGTQLDFFPSSRVPDTGFSSRVTGGREGKGSGREEGGREESL